MQKPAVVVVLLSALAAAASLLLVPDLLGGGSDVPVGRWTPADEVVVEANPEDPEAASADAVAGSDLQRQQVEADELGIDERTELTLRGRIVDRFRAPVAGANVWLDFGRGGPRGFGGGGRDRRVPDPVRTDDDGRFAFQGQTFRNLRITLLVTHRTHAPQQFDRNLGEVGTELDLGELVVTSGGELLGRVVDLAGNAIPGAEVRLQPEGDNPMRFQRDRESLLPPGTTDQNGYYRFANVAAGEWRIAGTARRHENGTTDAVTAVDEQRTDVADLVLGPGYELAGLVLDRQGQPIAEAEVTARPRRGNGGNDGGGRGGRGGRGGDPFGGNDYRTRTDREGRFAIDHLPDALVDVTAQKTGYLPTTANELDPEQTQPLFLTLEDGLKIQGTVIDAVANAPVTRFSVRAQWRRALPVDGRIEADLQSIVQQLRDGNLDEATRNVLRERMQALRSQARDNGGFGGNGPMGGRGGRGGQRGGPGGGPGNDRARAENHPGGEFVETGLLEGVYVVQVESDDHAPYRSEEVELRLGAPMPMLKVALTRGFVVAGIVKGADGKPLADARVELRRATEPTSEPAALPAEAGARGGRGGRMQQRMQQWNGGGGPVQTATTGKDGTFALQHAPAGRYTVDASGKGHQDAKTEPFALNADVQGIALVLQPLGRLRGRVLGATPEQLAEVRVVAAPIGSEANLGAMFRGGGGGQPFAMVSPDGSYLFAELNPGDYAVRAFVGQGMRELFQQFVSGQMVADVTVKAGAESTFDVSLMLPQTGTVRGSVLHNNTPATGFQVSLQPQDDGQGGNGGFGGMGGPGGFGGRGGRGRNDNARVDEQGRFEIKDVQAGTYRLSVSADRRGGALHTETIVVVAQGASESTISILTSSVEGTVTVADGTAAADLDGQVVLLPGATEMPQDGASLRNGNGLRARVQDGTFTIEQVPPGPYLAVLSIRGRMRTAVQVQAQLGQRTSISIPLGVVDPNAGQNGPRRNAQPGAAPSPGGALPAGGNARPQPGGQRRGG